MYVDGYVLAVKKGKLNAYKKMAQEGGKVWKKHGALQYFECVGDDLTSVNKWGGLAFPKMIKAKKGETVFFSFVIYKSKKHRDQVNAKVHKDMGENPDMRNMPMPFEMNRMAYGGFKPLVQL